MNMAKERKSEKIALKKKRQVTISVYLKKIITSGQIILDWM